MFSYEIHTDSQVLSSDFKLLHLCYLSYNQYFYFIFGNLQILEVRDQIFNDTTFVSSLNFSLLWNACPHLADPLRCHLTPKERVGTLQFHFPICASTNSWFSFLDFQTHFGIQCGLQYPLKFMRTTCHPQKPKKISSSEKYTCKVKHIENINETQIKKKRNTLPPV